MNTVVDVLIFRGVSQDYTYLVPQTLAEHLSVGTHVRIPLGRGTAEGIVTCISEIESDIAALKPILGVLDKKPTLPAALMDLMVWMRRTYRLTGMKAYQSVLGATISDTKSDSVSSTADTQPATLPPLTSDQAEAIETISAPYGPAEFLIEGVTGSGKTRCYLELVGRCISKGQSAIILIPEIALTPQT
ncbi:MAG: DEAD/DEAH box helicase family protein, partial [Candidatus Margulisiibacteriota bacterium]